MEEFVSGQDNREEGFGTESEANKETENETEKNMPEKQASDFVEWTPTPTPIPETTPGGNPYTGQYTGSADTPRSKREQKKRMKQQKKEEKKARKAARKAQRKGRGVVVAAVILSLLVGAAAGAGSSYYMLQEHQNTWNQEKEDITQKTEQALQETAAQMADQKTALQQMTSVSQGSDVRTIAQECLPSVVAITTKTVTEVRSMWGTFTQEGEGSGSGVIIGTTDDELLIVTNYHVISGSQSLSVLFSYQENEENAEVVSAKVKDYIENKDLAVISIKLSDLSNEVMDNIKVATIGSSDDLELGEQVVAIGNALGYGQSVTTGIVSAKNRPITISDSAFSTTITNNYLQTDAAINPGNSGGALFNMKGELVGINSVKVNQDAVESMGYAIPISDVIDDITGMMDHETRDQLPEEERGYLGIGGTTVTEEISSTYGLPRGVYLNSITDNSPADRAGLRKNMVITALEGRTVYSMEELQSALSYYAIGETVQITAMVPGDQEYTEKTFEVTLGTAQEAGISSVKNTEQQQQQPQQSSETENNENGFDYGQFFGQENPFQYFFRNFGR